MAYADGSHSMSKSETVVPPKRDISASYVTYDMKLYPHSRRSFSFTSSGVNTVDASSKSSGGRHSSVGPPSSASRRKQWTTSPSAPYSVEFLR